MNQPEHCIARIVGADGNAVGTGFLVSRNWLMTCAHVVAAAGGEEDGKVRVHFPHLGIAEPRLARCLPEAWYPYVPPAEVQGMADIAILAIDEPVEDAVLVLPPFDPGDVTGVAAELAGETVVAAICGAGKDGLG